MKEGANLARKINGERRLLWERRRFSYSNYIPERRSGEDRRQSPDALDIEASRTDTESDVGVAQIHYLKPRSAI